MSAGDYYVAVTVVDSYYYSSGQYSLTTAFTAGNQSSYESESNNTLATATSATRRSEWAEKCGQLSPFSTTHSSCTTILCFFLNY